jgi:hypothetical protein
VEAANEHSPAVDVRAPAIASASASASVSAPAVGVDARSRSGAGLRLLVVVGIVLLAARVVYVAFVPDLDGDAYAHFGIGRAVLQNPTDLGPHWVWLPGYHFLLAGLQRLGASFADVRRLNAVLQAGAPLLLYAYSRLRHDRAVSLLAAACWSVCSVPNAVGTSALGEVPYTLFVLGAAYAIDAGEFHLRPGGILRWSILAGVLLTLACTMRYEAWAAVAALGVVACFRVRRWGSTPAFAIPAACIGGYIVFRRVVDGEWLWFIHETLKFTTMQRDVLTRSRLFELTWFPFVLPFKLLGPALFLVPLGALGRARGRSLPQSAIVPLAIAMFLLSLYMGRSMLGLARYFSALMPFACVLIAKGAVSLDGRSGRARPFALAALVSLTVTMTMTMTSFARLANADRADLRREEARVSGR